MIYRDEEELFGHSKIKIIDSRVEIKDLDFFKEKYQPSLDLSI